MGGGVAKMNSPEFIEAIEKLYVSDLVIPGVHVQNERNPGDYAKLNLSLTGVSSIDLIKWVSSSNDAINKIADKPKADSDHLFREFQELYIKEVLGKQQELPHDYMYWGDYNCRGNLPVFLRTNPFFASALRSHRNAEGSVEFEINCSDESSNLFNQTMKCMDKDYVHVDASFDSSMNLIKIRTFLSQTPTQTIYEWSSGDAARDNDDAEIEKACAHLLFNLGYYSEVFHATIHVVHYMLDCAIVGATGSEDIEKFTDPYIPNVAIKYFEVKKLLFGHETVLTGGLFRADTHKVLHVAKQWLVGMFRCATADEFLTTLLLRDVLKDDITLSTLRELKLLEQFLNHANLISGYADEMCAAFQAAKSDSVPPTDELIAKFFADTYENPTPEEMARITTLNAWIQLYSVTGIVHGATLSFSRLMATPPMVKLFSNGEKYTAEDTGAILTATGTIVGVIEEHYVFSNKLRRDFLGCQHKFGEEVSEVMKKYAEATCTIKADYLATLKAEPETFKRHGWILSDYCPDGVDGKQLTICTYI